MMRGNGRKIYRFMLWFMLFGTFAGMLFVYRFFIIDSIPDTILLRKGKEEQVSFYVPVSAAVRVDASEKSRQENSKDFSQKSGAPFDTETGNSRTESLETATDASGFYDTIEIPVYEEAIASVNEIKTPVATTLSLESANYDRYEMQLRLFGILPMKSVKINVVSDKEVYACGMPIGIYIKTRGVLVIDTGTFMNAQAIEENPSGEILQSGDYILAVNGQILKGKREFVNWVENCNGEELILTIVRKGESSDVKVQPKQNEEGKYKAGIWVRDSAQGIGTLTYFTKEGTFGALGHGISDSDTGELMALGRGSIYLTDIISIRKGLQQEPGELTGILSFEEEDYLGKILDNTNEGIYGVFSMEHLPQKDMQKLYDSAVLYPLALKQEVHEGEAQIYCQVAGEADFYDVEITQMRYDKEHQNQGIMLTVTDPDLLTLTGGIVQGMFWSYNSINTGNPHK